jgi:tryptophan-rich sensory protein
MVGGELMRQRSRPRWNVVSVLAPFAGLALAIPFGLSVVWITDSHPAGMAKPSASFFAVSVGIGLLSGCMALARSERLWGISIVGLAVNAAILALLVYWDPWSGPF